MYYMVYTDVKSFTIVKNRKCGQVTSHCRKARPNRADLSLFLNVPVVTVKSETDAPFCRMFLPRDRSCVVLGKLVTCSFVLPRCLLLSCIIIIA